MPARSPVDPRQLRDAFVEIAPWLREIGSEPACGSRQPERDVVATAVRLSLRMLNQLHPGSAVEVRVPPFGAVQCMAGPAHSRGTPACVLEAQPREWLAVACGQLSVPEAQRRGGLSASGTRASAVAEALPLLHLADPDGR